MKPTVRLLSFTNHPIETIFACWEASRHNKMVLDPDAVAFQRATDKELDDKVRSTFSDVLAAGIPVAENVSFTFLLENVSVALREQMVRHRIGHHFGDRLGVDIVPDLADSTWWAQSMRILDMGKFASEERFDIPESIRARPARLKVHRRCAACGGAGYDAQLGGKFSCAAGCHNGQKEVEISVEDFYVEQMGWIQSAYNRLTRAGVPLEDARNLIPLGATSRITWTLNLTALQHVVGKRGCWILQLGIWEPIIRGMIEALAAQIDPLFRSIIAPPCVKGGKYTGCHFKLDNSRRICGEDEIPPCRLFISQEPKAAREMSFAAQSSNEPGQPFRGWVPLTREGWALNDLVPAPNHPQKEQVLARSARMRSAYGQLWGFDPDKGPGSTPPAPTPEDGSPLG